MMNFRNTVMFATRLCGLSPSYSRLNEETRWLTNKVVTTEQNQIGIEVRYQGFEATFTPERIIAMYLSTLYKQCIDAGCTATEIVISVPGYLNEFER
jgi:molecular chaperone DnaK (HSP70)